MELYNDNCINIMRKLSDNYIDLIITSPPYDDLREYNKSSNWNFEIFQNIANELSRVLKDGGVIVWIVNDKIIGGTRTGTSFKQALYFKNKCQLNIHDVMIWQKETYPFSNPTRYTPIYEFMFIFSKGKPKTINLIKDKKNKWFGNIVHGTDRNKDGSTTLKHCVGNITPEFGVRFNIWKQNTVKNNISNHPAPFPLTLIQDHIITWSNENDLVLDPLMGSGTTGIACKNLNRNFIGIEIDKTYFEYAKNAVEYRLI